MNTGEVLGWKIYTDTARGYRSAYRRANGRAYHLALCRRDDADVEAKLLEENKKRGFPELPDEVEAVVEAETVDVNEAQDTLETVIVEAQEGIAKLGEDLAFYQDELAFYQDELDFVKRGMVDFVRKFEKMRNVVEKASELFVRKGIQNCLDLSAELGLDFDALVALARKDIGK